ncbi:MAG: phosphoribosyltransferase [Sedimenticola sp.]
MSVGEGYITCEDQNVFGHYEIKIPRLLRDNAWSISIGTVQSKIDDAIDSGSSLIVDCLECKWIDPMPLASLLLELVTARSRGISIDVLFLDVDDGPDGQENHKVNQNSPNRLISFLITEGFFSQLISHDITSYIGKNEVTLVLLDNYKRDIKVRPSYADAHFIPLSIFSVPNIDINDIEKADDTARRFAAKTVENLVSDIEVLLHAHCGTPARSHVLFNLRAVIQELLHNVQEHAYANNEMAFAALYVRYRKGGAVASSIQESEIYEHCVSEEYRNCPLANREWLDGQRGCLEVFFIDRGIGLVKSFSKKDKVKGLKSILIKAFYDGASTKDKRTTEHGGLKLLHTLLSRSIDYVRVIDGGAWFGCEVPFERKVKTVIKPISPEEGGKQLKGLGYHIRLGWNEPTVDEETWLRFNENEVSNVWNDLSKHTSQCEELFSWFSKHHVWDERFESVELKRIKSEFILWLPKENRMKWDILSRLEYLAGYVDNNCTLIIADIPSREAAMYKAAMSHARFMATEKWPSKFCKVVLSTNRWEFAYAEHKSEQTGYHGFSTFSVDDVPKTFSPNIKKKDLGELSFRRLVVQWLKWHDSSCFWREVKRDKRLYLAEEIVWSEDDDHKPVKTICGYLDFPATVHNSVCSKLYRNSLSRIFGLVDESKIEIVPVDSLSDPVIHDVYAHEIYNPPNYLDEEIQKIAVGSVFVSGSTLKATGLSRSVHYFVHGSSDSKTSYPALLHWKPEQIINKERLIQKRIGKTSAIAPGGWLSIEIPRHDKNGKVTGECDPESSYTDWQNTTPLVAKVGHWCYEGHHDLLTINIVDAVEDAFARNGPLAKYLINNILSHIGVTKDKLKFDYQDEYPVDKVGEGILVYRSHPASEKIITRLLSVVNDSHREEIFKRIFPILPLRKRFGSSTLLIPPRMKNEILDIKGNENVLLFDDAGITGRTIQDIRVTLSNMGAKKIIVMLIANRLRLPSDTPAVKYYWRLDVPTMGKEGNCALCNAIQQAGLFTSNLVSGSNSLTKLKDWIKEWEAVSPLTKWNSGLSPIPVAHEDKNYCYRGDGEHEQYLSKIPIFKSTGLTIHAAEIHAMTARDDYGLKKIAEQDEPAVKVELAASQLLLFGDELDQDLIQVFIEDGLLKPMIMLPENSPVSGLALLVVIRSLNLLTDQAQKHVALQAKKKIDKLQSRSHGLLLVAYLLSRNLIDQNDDQCYQALRLLSTRHSSVSVKLRMLFRETITSTGHAHSEPIPRLYQSLRVGRIASETEKRDARNSLASLKDIVDELGSEMARCQKRQECGEVDYEKRYFSLLESLGVANSNLENIVALSKVLDDLNCLADCYFYRISPKEEYRGSGFKHQIIDIYGPEGINWDDVWKNKDNLNRFKPKIKQSSRSGLNSDFGGAEWVWIPWHKHIVCIVRDLISNVVHRKGLIIDPFGIDNSTADMWIWVDYQPGFVSICFENSCQEDNSLIFDKIRENTKDKTLWDSLEELGGGIAKMESESRCSDRLVIELTIPYASHLKASVGGKISEKI